VTDCAHRSLEANGIRMHIAEQDTGPLVLLCHGFPESWYSWRHQLPALAAAGYRAVAPDMCGYGQTDRPESIEQYTLLHMAGDMVGLLDELGVEQAVIVGHDFVDHLTETVPNLKKAVILPGCAHWTQQERPEAVNTELITFLRQVEGR
jgi:pimeloyl-ACP methyl ester carboxylesterase